ncbi:MAG: sel1 repeat family protein, partial [Bacteroidales bacterium]|nr:sel1 repeat family protein [Bacteroidales bacterium]
MKNMDKEMMIDSCVAEQYTADEMCNMGMKYEDGDGVEQDFTEAARWYRMAADKGDPIAQLSLGLLYEEGNGVPENHAEAAKWYRQAAEQDERLAQYDLGR